MTSVVRTSPQVLVSVGVPIAAEHQTPHEQPEYHSSGGRRTGGAFMASIDDEGALAPHGEGCQHGIPRQEQSWRCQLLKGQLHCLLAQLARVQGGLCQHERVL